MTVYVVETGCYENSGVAGVYKSPEAAMAAHPVPADYKYPATRTAGNMSRTGGWQRREDVYDGKVHVSWSNGLDWDDAAEITPYELEGVRLDEEAAC